MPEPQDSDEKTSRSRLGLVAIGGAVVLALTQVSNVYEALKKTPTVVEMVCEVRRVVGLPCKPRSQPRTAAPAIESIDYEAAYRATCPTDLRRRKLVVIVQPRIKTTDLEKLQTNFGCAYFITFDTLPLQSIQTSSLSYNPDGDVDFKEIQSIMLKGKQLGLEFAHVYLLYSSNGTEIDLSHGGNQPAMPDADFQKIVSASTREEFETASDYVWPIGKAG